MMSYIKEGFELGMKINLLNGRQLKVYDMIDAMTNDQTNDNTLEIIQIIQDYDADYSGIFDLDEFSKFIYDIRHKIYQKTKDCTKKMVEVFDSKRAQLTDDEIYTLFIQCVEINLLDDDKFTCEEFVDILSDHPDNVAFKAINKKLKLKNKEDEITYNDFKILIKEGEQLTKSVNKFNSNFSTLLSTNLTSQW